jgi:TetR/AcrR family tetracycline transcriptional repressor
VTATAKTARRRRGSIIADDVVDAAIRVIERGGLSSMTMPALATEMGVPVTSIYWHLRTKDELVHAVARRVTAELYDGLAPIDPSHQWDDELIRYFVGFRASMLEHRAFVELMAARSGALWADTAIRMLISQRLESALAILTHVGVSAADAVRLYTALSTYVRGFVTLEVHQAREAISAEELSATRYHTAALDPATFPNLSAIPVFDEAMRYDDDQFMLGLRLIVAGIQSHMGASDLPIGSRRRR